MPLLELLHAINVAAGTQGLEFNAACNAYAGTTGLEGQAALNVAAGTQGLEIQHVLNVLAGTTGLEAQHAANLLPPPGGGSMTPIYSYGWEPTGLGGWADFGPGSVTRVTTPVHAGVGALQFTPAADTSPYVYDGATQPTAPGFHRYTAWVRRAAADNVQLAIEWFDSGFASLGVASGVSTAVSAGVWTELTMTASAPVNTANVSLRVVLPGATTAADILYIDDVLLERA